MTVGGRGHGGAGRARERGSALAVVAILMVVATGLAATLLLATMTASRAAEKRLEETRARWAARSAVEATLDAITRAVREGREPRGVDGRADSLASVVEADGPLTDLRGRPDGSFTARVVRRAAGPSGEVFEVEAYGKFGRAVRGFSALAEPAGPRAFDAGVFGVEGANVSGRGRMDAYDSSVGEGAIPGLDLFASNGPISLGNSSATGDGERGGPGSSGNGANGGGSGGRAPFVGAIYAPAADMHVAMPWTGGPLAEGAKLVLAGNVLAGRDAAVERAGPVIVEGTIGSRERAASVEPVAWDPPSEVGDALSVAGCEVALEAGTHAFRSVHVAKSGVLRAAGAVELYVLGDLLIEGRVVVPEGSTLRVVANGALRVAPGGSVEAARPPQAIFSLATDSIARGDEWTVELHVASVRGALVGRRVKITGGLDMRYDRALASARAATVAIYRAAAMVDRPAPWASE